MEAKGDKRVWIPRPVNRDFFLIVRTDRIIGLETMGSYTLENQARCMMELPVNTSRLQRRKVFLVRVRPVRVLEVLEEA